MRYKSTFATKRQAPARGYFKDGVELLYANRENVLDLVFLPAYNPDEPDNECGWVPSLTDPNEDEAEFYTMFRAAKFVGHGSHRSSTSLLSPTSFDKDAIDPYEVLYQYCSKSDYWSYLTDGRKGKNYSGDVNGAVIPNQRDVMVANVMDLSQGERGGVFVTELSEGVAKALLYSKDGSKIKPGILYKTSSDGRLVYGDITNPEGALGIEVFHKNGYSARPMDPVDGAFQRFKIPQALLPHRRHMENPLTFVNHPGEPQEIVDKIAALLRGYHDNPKGIDETAALKEALDAEFGEGTFKVDVPASKEVVSFGGRKELSPGLRRLLDKQGFVPAVAPYEDSEEKEDEATQEAPAEEQKPEEQKPEEKPAVKEPMPGEDIDPADIANIRAMLSGGKQ